MGSASSKKLNANKPIIFPDDPLPPVDQLIAELNATYQADLGLPTESETTSEESVQTDIITRRRCSNHSATNRPAT
jgi:hypothetical protein